MAATLISTVSLDKIANKWNTPYTTESLNRQYAVLPRGIVRGFMPTFDPITSTLTLSADTLTGDSMMILRAASAGDKYGLLYREEGNVDIVIDVVGLPANTIILVGVKPIYTINNATVVEWTRYLVTDYEAATTDEAIIVGAFDITTGDPEFWCRDDSWKWTRRGTATPIPLISGIYSAYDYTLDGMTLDAGTGTTGEDTFLSDFTAGAASHSCTFHKSFKLFPTDQIFVSFLVKPVSFVGTLGDAADDCCIKATLITGGGPENAYLAPTSQTSIDLGALTDSQWTRITGNIRTSAGTLMPADVLSCMFVIETSSAGVNGTLNIDDFQVYVQNTNDENNIAIRETRDSKLYANVGGLEVNSIDFNANIAVLPRLYADEYAPWGTILGRLIFYTNDTHAVCFGYPGLQQTNVMAEGRFSHDGDIYVKTSTAVGFSTIGQVVSERFAYNKTYNYVTDAEDNNLVTSFAKCYKSDEWFPQAANNFTGTASALSHERAAGKHYCGVDEVGAVTATYHIPLHFPPCIFMENLSVWGMKTSAGAVLTVKLVKWAMADDAPVAIADTTLTFTDFTGSFVKQTLDVSAVPLPDISTDEAQYFIEVSTTNDGALSAGVSSIILSGFPLLVDPTLK